MMFCTECGSEIPDNSNVCPNCGANLKIIDVPNENSESKLGNFLSNKRDDETELAVDLIKPYKKLLKNEIGSNGIKELRTELIRRANIEGLEGARRYFNYTLERINYVENKKPEYRLEAKLADTAYKSYVTDGVSRLEKVNGRFLASQTVKLDMIIEQNNQIINLLEEIAKK